MIKNNNQKGITLTIVFLLMTIMIAVVLSISTIVFNEIRIIGDVGNSVVAFPAADKGIEKTLYYDEKQIPVGGTRGFCNTCNVCPECTGCTLTGNDCNLLTCKDCQLTYNVVDGEKTTTVSAKLTPDEADPMISNLTINSKGLYRNTAREMIYGNLGSEDEPEEEEIPGSACQIAWFKLDEDPTVNGAGTVIDTKAGNNGTPVGPSGANNLPQPSIDVPLPLVSPTARSLRFDATDDQVSLPDSLMDNEAASTISAWVYLNNTSGDDSIYNRGSTAGYGSSGTRSYFYLENGVLYRGSKVGNTAFSYRGLSSAILAGTWTHLAATVDPNAPINSRIQLYVNGSLASMAAETWSGAFVSTDGLNNMIGKTLHANSYFDGKIDDIRMYNCVLTPTEISELYAGN